MRKLVLMAVLLVVVVATEASAHGRRRGNIGVVADVSIYGGGGYSSPFIYGGQPQVVYGGYSSPFIYGGQPQVVYGGYTPPVSTWEPRTFGNQSVLVSRANGEVYAQDPADGIYRLAPQLIGKVGVPPTTTTTTDAAKNAAESVIPTEDKPRVDLPLPEKKNPPQLIPEPKQPAKQFIPDEPKKPAAKIPEQSLPDEPKKPAAAKIPEPSETPDGNFPVVRDDRGQIYYLITPAQYRALRKSAPDRE